jgi:murein hydrolase activator
VIKAAVSKIFLVACLSGLILAALTAPGFADPRERQQLEAQLEQLRDEIEQIRDRLAEALGQRDSALDDLATAEREVSSAERARRQTGLDMAEVNQQIVALTVQQQVLTEQVTDSANALGRQLALAYRHGGQSRLKLFLNQDDPRQLNRHLAYHGYISRARLRLIEDMNQTLTALELTRTTLEQRHQELDQLAQQQETQLRQLQQARRQREQALRVIEGRIQTRQETLTALERDASELAELLDELASALADIPPDIEAPSLADLRGQLPRPARGQLRYRFGEHRTGDLAWNGWLIAAPEGSEVQAIGHGRVAYADWLRGYGLILIIDHGDGFMSLYGHNEALLRDVGDWVRPGDVIASVGQSGGVSEVGLYFELRRNGQPINPANWLQR